MPHQGTPVGRVRALYRYPVKSTSGQAVGAAAVTPSGLEHDRRWAVYTHDGGIASGKRTRRFRPVPGLLDWTSELDGHDGVPLLRSPAGVPYRVDDPAASEALTTGFGQELVLKQGTTLQHHDESPLHLLTTSSLAALADLLGGMVEERRFRPNLVLDTGSAPLFLERDWTGVELAIGADVIVTVDAGMPRCTMIDQPQAGMGAGPKALRALSVHNGMEFGVQARVDRIGAISVGDVVTLRSTES
ncbi:MOSC N-terminal beta barrel domain-containing protein [Arthrobacter sp. SX1312]|uniref:MOSC domain-containing protein n=1 Tax=Arthrobacter sp. SX1312 TaxID=2058896 RepID=UPI0015E1F093|nr:MOSC N-terminal beta barrel domain-containing protein [Arthrobacter sp. SX1312]